jgi:phospholipid/cholesterol/gamma-HCH transport system substrate-binding protein
MAKPAISTYPASPMDLTTERYRIHPAWWTAALVIVVGGAMWLCSAIFAGTLTTYVPVTVTSERAGLVMESGAKVKMRGVQVGRVSGVDGGRNLARLHLELFPDQVGYIPANAGAQIRASTAFGAKYVDLTYPEDPSLSTFPPVRCWCPGMSAPRSTRSFRALLTFCIRSTRPN